MTTRNVMRGEGASISWIRGEASAASGMMVCPMLGADPKTVAATAQELYRLAYEQARAAMRPSIYELAWMASEN